MTTGNTAIRVGRVVVFFTEKGFGFLAENTTDASGKEVVLQHFFHITSCNFEPRNGMVVQFCIGEGRRGPAAVDVKRYDPTAAMTSALEALAGNSTEVSQ
jgi:cold shock CspA family protein